MNLARARVLPAPRKLSIELAELHARAGERAVTLREVIFVLRQRAYMLLIVLLALPFIQPIPLPGLSTPLGIAIALIALRLSLGQRPWLPKKIQRTKLPAGFFGKVMVVTAKLLRFLETVLRPRWPVMTSTRTLNQLHAIIIFSSAAILLLPLPVPFSNFLPAWAIFLVACGLLERDGLFITLGYVAFVVGALYFFLFGTVVGEALQHFWLWLRNHG